MTDAGTGDLVDYVLRCWPETATWGRDSVIREQAVLELLATAPVPAPRIVGVDPSGSQTGSPASLTTWLPGAVQLDPPDLDRWMRTLCRMLARIHALSPSQQAPMTETLSTDDLDLAWMRDEGLAREARAACADGAQRLEDPLVLCHGDYQHFNILWSAGEISGVVDWPNAGRGSRGLDVGHCRLNLAVLYSADLADRFRTSYEEETGCAVDHAVDLRALLEFGPGWQRFIPRQVLGRRSLDVPGMPTRVRDLVALTLQR